MKKRLYGLLGVVLCASGCDGGQTEGSWRLPASMSDYEAADYLPYTDFYSDGAKSGILDYEAERGGVFTFDDSSDGAVAFIPADTDFTRVEYVFLSMRQFISVTLYGARPEVLWSTKFVEKLERSGYALKECNDTAVVLIAEQDGVRVELRPADAGGLSVAVFTPTRELPELPPLEHRLIHPFHRMGATLEEIAAAEHAAGRMVYESNPGQLYYSEPPAGTIFQRFGFFMFDGKLIQTMSLLTDGAYLDTDAFVDEMEAAGFIHIKRAESYDFFRDPGNTLIVRSANMAPYPTIEYLPPESVEIP